MHDIDYIKQKLYIDMKQFELYLHKSTNRMLTLLARTNTGIGSPFLWRTILSMISFHSVIQFNVDGLQESKTTNAAEAPLKNDWVNKYQIPYTIVYSTYSIK